MVHCIYACYRDFTSAVPSQARLFRVQTALLLVAVAAPWFANATYLLRISPGALDFTLIAFVVSALALGGGLQRYRLPSDSDDILNKYDQRHKS